jgi:hypothetical protein
MKSLHPYKRIFLFLFLVFTFSCEDYLEVDPPINQIPYEMVFEDEQTANSAVTTLYSKLRDEVLLTGNLMGLSVLMGLYADELNYHTPTNEGIYHFYNHSILSSDTTVKSVWNNSYKIIYMCNSALEGLELSSLNESVKNKLKGELLFMRSILFFYLTNLFNDIPYVISTDYIQNQSIGKTTSLEVYQNIVDDLVLAKSLLGETYESTERIRANKYVVSAFLARVYLYSKRWNEAEMESSFLIQASHLFHLEADISKVFLKENPSTIFQLKSKNPGDNTNEGRSFALLAAPPSLFSLHSSIVNGFEAGDLRKEHWVKEVSDGVQVWFAPFKYKQNENTGVSQEYSILFRLEEQYLIRAEARLNLGSLSSSVDDLNLIRTRVGLAELSDLNFNELQEAIMQERKSEFFTEHGHRWFDLKRKGLATEVLTAIKPNWQDFHQFLPIPIEEILLNPNLNPQNSGY